MQRLRSCFIASLILMLLPLSVTTATTNTEQEVQHPFNFIVASDCIIIRNDTEYKASEARYQIRCQNQLLYCDSWPEQELQRYRTS